MFPSSSSLAHHKKSGNPKKTSGSDSTPSSTLFLFLLLFFLYVTIQFFLCQELKLERLNLRIDGLCEMGLLQNGSIHRKLHWEAGTPVKKVAMGRVAEMGWGQKGEARIYRKDEKELKKFTSN